MQDKTNQYWIQKAITLAVIMALPQLGWAEETKKEALPEVAEAQETDTLPEVNVKATAAGPELPLSEPGLIP